MSEDLQKRIQILERKLERQKNARKEAEIQLEAFSREIFYSNEALKQSVIEAQKRQSELEFLATATSSVASETTVSELVSNSLELTARFINANKGLCVFCRNGELLKSPKPIVWLANEQSITDEEPDLSYMQYVPIDEKGLLSSWAIEDISEDDHIDGNWLVSINFALIRGQFGWITLILPNEYLDEEALYVLDTAKEHLRTGVTKRIHRVNSQISQSKLQTTAEHLAVAKKQLVQAERMSTLGQLSAGIAHEINNPIGFIKSNQQIFADYLKSIDEFISQLAQAIDKDKALSGETFSELKQTFDIEFLLQDSKEMLKDNQEGVTRVSEIVSNLKEFSHVAEREQQEVDINECVRQAVKIAWNNIKYQHVLDLQLNEDTPNTYGNSGELQQVFINLVVNAAQAMTKPGKLSITSTTQDKEVLVRVTDNGVGMNSDTIQKLFQPFFTTKEVGEGTGLGLSVSKAIIDSHGGDISVDSELGKGTTMTVSLPIKLSQ